MKGLGDRKEKNKYDTIRVYIRSHRTGLDTATAAVVVSWIQAMHYMGPRAIDTVRQSGSQSVSRLPST